MTVATLEEMFTVPEHPAAEWGERYGYYEETVHGRRMYVTKDDNARAIVGPKRHRARGVLALGRKRRRTAAQPNPGALERTITLEDVRTEVGRTLARTAQQLEESMTTVDFSKIAGVFTYPTPPTPQKKVGMFKRVRNWFTERFYDEEWHKGAQRLAMTVLLWAFTLTAITVFVKGALWLVTL